MASNGTLRIDFVCVHNSARSQMAAAFAEREREERGLDGVVEIRSGGTNPADHVNQTVAEAMDEVGIDISDRSPSYVVLDELKESHYLVTMGCTIAKMNPAQYGVESRTWDLEDPEGSDIETVRTIRDDVRTRVEELFDEIEDTANDRAAKKSLTTRVRTAVEDALSL